MATWFVYDSGDNDPGYGPTDRDDPSLADNWSNAFTTLLSADTAASDGDTIYIASDHSETTSSTLTINFDYSVNDKVKIISIKRSTGELETMATGGGSIATTAASGADIFLKGSAYFNGVKIFSDDNLTIGGGLNHHIYTDCDIRANDSISFTSNHETAIELNNCTISVITPGSFSISKVNVTMKGGSISKYDTAYGFLRNTYAEGAIVTFIGVDLSSIPTGAAVINDTNTESSCIIFERCKMWSGWSVPDLLYPAAGTVKLHSCDTADGQTFFTEVSFCGRTIQDTANHRTPDFSAKMVSNANTSKYTTPLRFKLSEFYATANPTLTVEYIHEAQGSGSGGDLQDDEFWIEIEYPDSTDEALGKLDQSNRASTILATPADQDNSTESWTENLTGEVKQKSEVTISGGAAGIHTVWACLAKPSTTVYVDPDVTVS